MTITILSGYYRGVDKLNLSDGSNLGAPQLLSATPIDFSRVRLTFSAPMSFYAGSVILLPDSYDLVMLPSTEQKIVRVEMYDSTRIDLIVQNQAAVQYQVTVLGALTSDVGIAIDPLYTTLMYYGAAPPIPTGSRLRSFFGLEAGMQDVLQQTLPPELVSGPFSPNPDVTSPLHPMQWVTRDLDSASSIALLVIEGVNAIVNNVLQPQFFGTVVANGQGGMDVSINAIADMWPGRSRISWQLTLADLFNISNYSGTIDKQISLPVQEPPVEREALINVSFDFPFRFTDQGSLVTSRDEKSVEDNMRNSVMIHAGGIPLFSRIGSRVPLMPFDPNDQATLDLIGVEVSSAIAVGETRVLTDDRARVQTDASGNSTALVVPYKYKSTLKGWKDLRLDEPEFKSADKGGT